MWEKTVKYCADEFCRANCHERQAKRTWDIAFKAGEEREHKVMIGVAVDEGNKAYKAGIEKVVEYIGKPFEHHYRWFMTEEQSEYRHDKEDCFACKYEAQLKAWGIKEVKSGNK